MVLETQERPSGCVMSPREESSGFLILFLKIITPVISCFEYKNMGKIPYHTHPCKLTCIIALDLQFNGNDAMCLSASIVYL